MLSCDLMRDMMEQDWNPLAGRDIEVNGAKENERDSILCCFFFLLGEGQLCVLLQLFDICGLPELPS